MATLSKKRRTEIVNTLVDNCDCWDEDDKEVLNALTDDKLAVLIEAHEKVKRHEAVANAAAEGFKDGTKEWKFDAEKNEFVGNETAPEELVVNEDAKPQTMEEFMATAPPEVQAIVAYAQERESQEKATCIATITANELNAFDKEELSAMPLKQLEKLAAMARKEVAPKRVANYGGSAAPATTPASDTPEAPLTIPVMNHSRDK